MWVETIAFFLAISILLYSLLAGADFGAGILEAFAGKDRREEQREIISHAMGPVWEANHVWLILAVVILFMGFPKAFSALSITFHIPLTLMLFGIVLRGCTFTFRHYDAVRDRSHRYYSALFVISSFLTPLMLGVVAGGALLGATAPLEAGFYAGFVRPWANLFCFSVGVFTCVLFAFLAAVYLIGETRDPAMRGIFTSRAMIANALRYRIRHGGDRRARARAAVCRESRERGLDDQRNGHPFAVVDRHQEKSRSDGSGSRCRSGRPGPHRLVSASIPGDYQLANPSLDDLQRRRARTDVALLALRPGDRVGDYLSRTHLPAQDFQIERNRAGLELEDKRIED
jgi:hypothetical protein